MTGIPASITDPGVSPDANAKPSSAHPVMPPSINFTGRAQLGQAQRGTVPAVAVRPGAVYHE